eukprot:CAMPEP_0194775960 /NCGR_PEP_ID=MMETSP0323_2-20130528/61771_1 /TAXON_ID=2866 ORGANISM="Crypthecodinium cohnii, Strain Seligo" /NCGR_SAMPLE_ID=MMETSP0323_2 /ASSEMBLY_ACC=CAM_ASM_000346 /LENGTH=54 /DNA_ID=CAMNT_0039712157 /DNA_START=366 /DNA_END=526 /DNA_ORIENTATION=-
MQESWPDLVSSLQANCLGHDVWSGFVVPGGVGLAALLLGLDVLAERKPWPPEVA